MYKSSEDHPDMLRRSIMASALGTIGLAFPFASSGLQAKTTGVAKPNSMAQWMDAWTGTKVKDLHGGLYVFRFADPMWSLLRPIGWTPSAGQSYRPVDVPTGFVTDFASIPRAFYTLLPPDGNYSYAAVFHDYLYWTQERPREEADDIFRLAMKEFDISPPVIGTIYAAVRSPFGAHAWNQNARLKAGGEKRILIKFPDDPRTTWKQWKVRQDVFVNAP